MFEIGGLEILILMIMALVVLKPEDLPKAMRAFGKIIRRINRLARECYALFDDAAYEIEQEEKKQDSQE